MFRVLGLSFPFSIIVFKRRSFVNQMKNVTPLISNVVGVKLMKSENVRYENKSRRPSPANSAYRYVVQQRKHAAAATETIFASFSK